MFNCNLCENTALTTPSNSLYYSRYSFPLSPQPNFYTLHDIEDCLQLYKTKETLPDSGKLNNVSLHPFKHINRNCTNHNFCGQE
uniref:Ovule protein n=1 Tax=Ascaris lumbricoides TaxID=6252 RepID=A0A0M3HPV1_ASCLU